jgi:hypothetical protein
VTEHNDTILEGVSDARALASPNQGDLTARRRRAGEALERMTERLRRLEARLDAVTSNGDAAASTNPLGPGSRLVAAGAGAVAAAAGLAIARPDVAGAVGFNVMQTMPTFSTQGAIKWEWDAALTNLHIADAAWTITRQGTWSCLGVFSDIISVASAPANVWSWTVYAECRATLSPNVANTPASPSEAAAVAARMYARSQGGQPWCVALHCEPHHGDKPLDPSQTPINPTGESRGLGCPLFEVLRRFRYRRHIFAAPRMLAGVRPLVLRPVWARSWL